MVIDTSALLAILKVEPEAEAPIARLSQAGPRRLSTGTLLETGRVIARQIGEAGQAELEPRRGGWKQPYTPRVIPTSPGWLWIWRECGRVGGCLRAS